MSPPWDWEDGSPLVDKLVMACHVSQSYQDKQTTDNNADTAIACMKQAYDCGINFFDTAER